MIVIEVQHERYREVVACRVWLDPVSKQDTASRSMWETKT